MYKGVASEVCKLLTVVARAGTLLVRPREPRVFLRCNVSQYSISFESAKLCIG